MEGDLITEEAFGKATHLERFKLATKVLMGISGIKKLNALYAKTSHYNGLEFIEAVFQELRFHFELDETELNKIPTEGSFITVSNHPFGALDGLLLLYIVSKKRTDFKVMANFLLKEIKPIEDYFLSVNPFENRKEASSSLVGTKQALIQLKNGGGLGIFPAGEVSSFQSHQRHIIDKQWQTSILKLIKKAKVPVVPIFFNGSNSLLFHLLGMVHPNLRTLALPSEMLKKKGTKVKVRIGRPIKVSEQQEWEKPQDLGRFLRAKTYCLGSSSEVSTYFNEKLKRLKTTKPIAIARERATLIYEIEKLESYRILQQAEFELYLCGANQIPNLLHEIGRLREVTFRAVGEGSNKALDLDEYDFYYQHLFLWDKQNHQLAGAYRLGKGDDILKSHGKKGFYIHSLFKLKKEFKPILAQSIEMGRSFVVKEYQQKRLPLFLLWKGIMHFLTSKPEVKYLIGPVSISNNYSRFSRMLMVEFIRRFYFDHHLAKWVEPRKQFKVNFKKVEGGTLLEGAKEDMKKIDQIISDVEPDHAPLPVLIKKYIRQNAKIIGFNLDPKFNHALDGLMILDIDDLPKSSIEDLQKDMKVVV